MYPLPSNLPVLDLDDKEIGAGWRRVSVGETVRPWFEVFLLVPGPHWALTSCAGDKVSGRSHYRAPASLGAWCRVLWALARRRFIS